MDQTKMKCSVSSSYSFLLLAFLLLLVPYVVQPDDLISKTCKKTLHYNLCVSCLESDPESSHSDVKGLATIIAKITLSNATDTLAYIQELINQTTDPQLERPLDYCGEVYIPLVKYVLPQVMDALTNEEYDFANYGASKEADSCEKKFSGSIMSPLTERSQLMHDLCDVTVGIIKILLKGKLT